MLYLSNNLKEKKKKRNINNDLAVLPSHDIGWSDKRYDHEYWGRLERNWR